MATCAFLGLGTMGFPMAGHLAAAGHDVRVFNRTRARADAWAAAHDGVVADSPADAARGAEFVAVCVGADDDVRAVVTGPDGALAAMAPGSVLVDHTTASAELAREMGDAASAAGIGFVDAPISGGQVGAENGTLSIMCGGSDDDLARARPFLEVYGSTVTHLGPVGAGQLTKMCNQILCAGAIQGAAEAIAFGQSVGLDLDQVLGAVTQGAAGSWYLSNRGHTMVADEFDFGFAVDWLAKDLGLVRRQADAVGAATPLAELCAAYLERSQAAGDNRLDATAIVRRYREENGLAGDG